MIEPARHATQVLDDEQLRRAWLARRAWRDWLADLALAETAGCCPDNTSRPCDHDPPAHGELVCHLEPTGDVDG